MSRLFPLVSFPSVRWRFGRQTQRDRQRPLYHQSRHNQSLHHTFLRQQSDYPRSERWRIESRPTSSMVRRSIVSSRLAPIAKRTKSVIKRGMGNPILLGSGLWFSLWLWNWPVAVAIASGTVVAIGVYLYQLGRLHVSWFNHRQMDQDIGQNAMASNQAMWQQRVQDCSHRIKARIARLWSQCWKSKNRPLTIALLSGGCLALVVATVTTIYRDLHSLSLVLAMGLQLLMVSIIGYGFWQQSKGMLTERDETDAVDDQVQEKESVIDRTYTHSNADIPSDMTHTVDRLATFFFAFPPAKATARFAATVDLPTPPFPLATAIILLIIPFL